MSRPGRNWRVILALLCCAFLALAPALAEARAGGSFGGRPSSIGSRGTRSWENNGAQPLNRSLTPQPGQSGYASGPTYPAYGGSLFQRHPFLTGLAGGLFGSWLFGHAGNAGAGGGAGSAIGGLLWIAIIGFLIWLALRLFRRARGSVGLAWRRRLHGALGRSGGARGREIAAATSTSPMLICNRSSGCTRRSRKPGAPAISRAWGG